VRLCRLFVLASADEPSSSEKPIYQIGIPLTRSL
jgi:hypothetical protein